MKKTLLLIFLLVTSIATSQVQDLPIAFSQKGYVLAIDVEQKMIQIDFFTADKNLGDGDVLVSQVFTLTNCEIFNEDKNKITITDLRSSDEVLVQGQWFMEKNEYNIQKIIMQPKIVQDELEGRIDLISGEFAYVDGNKVKLGKGKKIKGDPDTGYKGLERNAFSEIKSGDYATVSGKYDSGGFYVAKSFTIAPDLETIYDKAAFKADNETYDKIYPVWIDPTTRKSLFGKNIAGLGKITNNDIVQEYVNKVGQKLIPEHIKKRKINFIFIVVDNPDLLAYVKANGLAFICTGLLLNLENEAQLAAVLGHEISHAIYEHQSGADVRKAKKEKKKGLIKSVFNAGKTAIDETLDLKKGVKDEKKEVPKTKEQLELEREQKKKADENNAKLNDLMDKTLSFKIDKNISEFSVEQEFQADRVGLCLLTLAGYDPREAPIVWKNIYHRYGKITSESEKSKAFDNQVKAFQELNSSEKQYDTKGLVNQALAGVLTIKKEDFKGKSVKTYPNEINRYKSLNNLVALYWNNTTLLEKTTNNEEEYRQIIKKITKSQSAQEPKEKTKPVVKDKKKK